jgi:cytoskeletal protein RodZ
MSETSNETPAPQRRHGRRARQLTPEEAAAQQQEAASVPEVSTGPGTGQIPPIRGAVAPPTGDAPLPTLRKYGKRARIIEIEPEPEQEQPEQTQPEEPSAEAASADAEAQPDTVSSGEQAPGEQADAERSATDTDQEVSFDADTAERAVRADGTAGAGPEGAERANGAATATATIERDADGVELGELHDDTAPQPRPAPRFEGKVLNRPENSSGKPLVLAIWILIAIAVVVLVVLLLTGIIGPGVGGPAALGTASALVPDLTTTMEVTPT